MFSFVTPLGIFSASYRIRRPRFLWARLLFIPVAFLSAAPLSGSPFPAGAGVVNVQAAPYGAAGDGIQDDTAALQQAINDTAGSGRTVYLPNGVYRLTGQLAMPEESENDAYFLTIQGESRDGVVLRLDDARDDGALEVFTNPSLPRALIKTAVAKRGWTNDAFMVNLFDLTIDTGSNNPGAIGLEYLANNQGTVGRVRIRTSDTDRRGVAGIEMSNMGLPGPAFLKEVEVIGFDFGLRLGSRQYGMTAEFLQLEEQRVAGVYNRGNLLNLRQLAAIQTRAEVPAVWNAAPGTNGSAGLVTLLDSQLEGVSGPAIRNGAFLYARNVSTSGYAVALEEAGLAQAGTSIDEWVSGGAVALFGHTGRSLGLPVRETPEAAWQAPADWINVADYGAVAGDGVDDSVAIQAAIDACTADRRTVYFPNPGNNQPYTIDSTIEVRGYCGHLIGMGAQLRLSSALRDLRQPVFRLVDASPEAESAKNALVVVERFFSGWGLTQPQQTTWLVNERSGDTLVRQVMFASGHTYDGTGASGDTFFEDVATHEQPEVSDPADEQPTPGYLIGANERFFARQLNVETRGGQLRNLGDAWIFGFKTEHYDSDALQTPHLETRNGGRTELLGGLIHPSNAGSGGVSPAAPPVFRIDNASASFVAMEPAVNDQSYPVVVEEIRGSVIRRLGSDEAPALGSAATQDRSFILPLFVGVPGNGNQTPLISRVHPGASEVSVLTGQWLWLDFAVSDDGLPQPELSIQWQQVSGPSAAVFDDAQSARTALRLDQAGSYEFELLVSDGELSAKRTLRVVARDSLPTAPSAGLYLHYPLNASSGSVVADANDPLKNGDLSDNFLDPEWMPASGVDGGALQLRAGDRHGIEFSSLDFRQLTFSSWTRIFESSFVYFHGYFFLPGIYAYSTPDRSVALKLFWDGAPDSFYDYETDPFILPEAETWYHLAIAFDGSDPANEPIVYVNGQPHVAHAESAVPGGAVWRSNQSPSARLFSYGGNLNGPNGGLGGLADETRLYDRVLSTEEVGQLARLNTVNAAPEPLAGSDLSTEIGQLLPLHGSATDDGLPNGAGSLVTEWQQLSGPGTAAFTDPSAPQTSVQFDLPGVYELQLLADDGAVAVVDRLSVTVDGDMFEAWRAVQFNEALGQWRSLPGADPDRDGRPNWLEFALGGDPFEADRASAAESVAGGRLEASIIVRSDDPGLEWTAETSSDLEQWSILPAAQVSATSLGAAQLELLARDEVEMGSADRRFLRFRFDHDRAGEAPASRILYPASDHRMFDSSGDGMADNGLDDANELKDKLIVGDTGANGNVWRSVVQIPVGGDAFNLQDASSVRFRAVVALIQNDPASLGSLVLERIDSTSTSIRAVQYGAAASAIGSVDVATLSEGDVVEWPVGEAARAAVANGRDWLFLRLRLSPGGSNGDALSDRLLLYSGSDGVNAAALRPALVLDP